MSALPFDIAAASVLGREHARAGRNNQDALCVRTSEHGLVAVVADGCGSQPCSELGAQLGVRGLVRAALARLAAGESVDAPGFLPALRQDVLLLLERLREDLGREAVRDFLFTVVGAVMTPASTLVFSAGDGVWALNGDVRSLGPFPGNAPPYLAYALVGGDNVPLMQQALLPTEDVHALLLGTDGVVDLEQLATTRMPEREECVGPLSRLWTEDRYFANPDALRRRLALLNRESVRADFTRRATGDRPAGKTTGQTTQRSCAIACHHFGAEPRFEHIRMQHAVADETVAVARGHREAEMAREVAHARLALEQIERMDDVALLSQAEVLQLPSSGEGQREGRPFKEYVGHGGARIWVGRGAEDNDALTFKVARPWYLWLHARGVPGSHVVLPLEKGHEVVQEALLDAAHLALHHSGAKGEPRGEVSYVPAKFVRKVKGGAPGQVTFTREKTFVVRMEPERLERLLKSRHTEPAAP